MNDDAMIPGAAGGATESPPQATRKQVTVLFCDVVDYTSRATSLDPEELADELRAFHRICGDAAVRHRGHISNYLGDGILALFGHPLADEAAPARAVRAGMAMVDGIARNNASSEWHGREAIRIRVGVATGEVVVGERAGAGRDQDEQVVGSATVLAARLQGLAKPNTILIGARTRRLTAGLFAFRHLAAMPLKGFVEAQHVWQILRDRPYKSRAVASAVALRRATLRFIGRRDERKRLLDNWRAALVGDARFVHLQGESGIGKSRLARVFEKSLPQHSFHRLRIVGQQDFAASPFKPIIDETHRWLRITANDDRKARREIVTQAMQKINLANADEHQLFNQLLNLDQGEAARDFDGEWHHRMVSALATFVIGLAKLRPLLLLAEDLHWADASTLAVLDAVVKRRGEAGNLLAIFISRRGFARDWPGRVDEMKLHGLDAAASARLLAAVQTEDAVKLPPALARKLVEKGGGVPLFLEESGWFLLSRLDAEELRDGDAAGGVYSQFAMPDSLQDLLNARLDSLAEAKPLAQLAAVFAGGFRYSDIAMVAGQNGIDADGGLDALLANQLLAVAEGSAVQIEDRYRFAHAYYREAAYASLLLSARRKYHRQIADGLCAGQPDLPRRQPELLAHHYALGGKWAAAAALWRRAGAQAFAQSASEEAVQHCYAGLQASEKLPAEERAELQLALSLQLAAAMTARGGYNGKRVSDTYAKARELAAAAGDARGEWTARYGLWRCHVSKAAFADAMRAAVKLKVLARRIGDARLTMTAFGLRGMTRMVSGKLPLAEALYGEAVALYAEAGRVSAAGDDADEEMLFGQEPYLTIRGLGAVNALLLGKPDEAAAEIAACVAAARATGHPYTLAETLRVAAMLHQIAGDGDALAAAAAETVRLATKHNFDGMLAAGNLFLHFHRLTSGAADADLHRRLDGSLQSYTRNYGQLFLPYFYGMVAEARLACGEHAAAVRMAKAGLRLAESGEVWWCAPLLGIKARAAEGGGLASPAEVDEWRARGMRIAEAQDAGFLGGRYLRG